MNSASVTILYSEVSPTRWLGQGDDINNNETIAAGAGGVEVVSSPSNGVNWNDSFVNSLGGFQQETGPLGCARLTAAGGVANTKNPNGLHSEGSNFAFWDGHVKWMKGTNVSAGINSYTGTNPYFGAPTQAACTNNNIAGGTQATMSGVGITATM